MPRTFALSAHYPVEVAAVYAAFTDEQYWLARLADSGVDSATLDSMTVDQDGTIQIATTQRIHHSRLPALAAQFHAGDLEVVRKERWSIGSARAARGGVTGKVLRAPARLSGDATLSPTDTGCRLDFAATVRVDIPLIGGKIESFIGTRLAELMTIEQRFTSTWVGRRG